MTGASVSWTRLAVLSDVHGNLQALQAVEADLDDWQPDAVIVNGDMVNRGPDGVAVMERIVKRGWPMVLGNHDDLVVMWTDRSERLPAGWFDDPFWRATGWCADKLDASGWTDTFRSLPYTREVASQAGRILISHGSPRHYREGYGPHLDDAVLSEIVTMHPYDVLVGSHTHQPHERRYGSHVFLNSGSVGTPFNGDPRAQYLRLEREADAWQPTFAQVPYDRAAALAVYATSGYLAEGGLTARIFMLELAMARSFLVPFLMWAEKRDLVTNEVSWHTFAAERLQEVAAPDEVGRQAAYDTGLLRSLTERA